jgi:hypothetical protein
MEQYLHCTIKTIRQSCYHLSSLRSTIPSKDLLNRLYSLPTMDITQRLVKFDFNKVENPTAEDLATRLSEIHKEMKDKLLEAQDRQKNNADKSRKVHPVINIGDKVWLLCHNLKTNRLCDKLDFRRFGPFSVVKKINDEAFRLELPPSIKIHPVFYVSLFEPYKESSISGRFHLLELRLKDKKNLKPQKSLIHESFEESWSILFNGRDTTLVKGPGNLPPIFVMLQKCFKNFIAAIQKSQVPRMHKSNTSGPTPTPYLNLSMV